MAEIRKHHPDADDGLGKLVRDALGERIRPTQPGQSGKSVEEEAPVEESDSGNLSASSLPQWPSDGPVFTYPTSTLGSKHDS